VPTLEQLSDAGGWAIFAFSVFAAAIGLVRRWWVPGWIYALEQEQRAKAETQAERNAESLARLARAADVNSRLSGHERA
jgi:hypothetical protein